MANYSLVINSKFQPFSFERYMQPLQIYAQLYDQERAAMEQQAAQYGILSNMVDPELDRDVYDAMQRYNDNLIRQRDLLSTVGLTPQGRRDLSALRQQYYTDVAPVQNWIQMRNKDIEAQRALELQTNGNVRFNKRAADTSLGYYRTGKPLDYKTMNLNAAMTEASALIQAISKRHVQTGQRPLGDYIESYKTTGYANLDELMANPEAKSALETVLNKYGFNSSDFTDEDKAALYQAVQEGANGGLAYDNNSTFTPNWRAQSEASLENNMKLKAFEKELDAQYDTLAQQQAGADGLGQTFDPRTPIDTDDIGMGPLRDNSYKQTVTALNNLGINEKQTKDGKVTYKSLILKGGLGGSKEFSGLVSYKDKNTGLEEYLPIYNKYYTPRVSNAPTITGKKTEYYYTGPKDYQKLYPNAHTFRVFNKDGTLMSESQFVDQAAPGYESQLRTYYKNKILPEVAKFNVGSKPTVGKIYSKAYSSGISQGTRGYIQGIPMQFNDNVSMLQTGTLAKIINGSGGAYEVKDALEDYAKGRRRKAGDIYTLLDQVGDKPNVYYHIINVTGRNNTPVRGLLISSGERKWFVPVDNMGGMAKRGFETLALAKANLDKREKAIEKYGLDAYLADPASRYIESSIQNYGTNAIQQISTSVFGEAKQPSYNIINPSFSDN